MNYIWCIALALLVSVVWSEKAGDHDARQWKLKPHLDSTSSVKLASLISNLMKKDHSGIDMDYFGGSSERMERGRSENRRSDVETQYVPNTDNRARVFYVSNPEVLEEYKKSLKKVMVGSSDSEDDQKISHKDLLQFLVQVDARLREREGLTTDALGILSEPKLNSILKDFRRRMDEDSGEDKYEKKPRDRGHDSEDNYRGHTFAMMKDNSNKKSKKSVYDSASFEKKAPNVHTWSKASVERDFKRKTTRFRAPPTERSWNRETERSWNREPESNHKYQESRERGPPLNKFGGYGPKLKGKLPNFISTPIPLSGRQGIYEEDK